MKKILMVLGLFLGVTQVHGFWDSCCCDQGLGTGFFVGAEGSFSSIHYHVRDDYTDSSPPPDEELYVSEYEVVQSAEGGGIVVGYGCSFCDCYRLALVFDAVWNGNKGTHAYVNGDIEEVFSTRIRNRYFLDLSLQPGIALSNCVLAYFKAGVSWADVQQRLTMTEDDSPYEIVAQTSRSKTPVGYVLGAGAQIRINSCLSVFVEYDWRRYSGGFAQLPVIFDPTDTDERITSRVQEMFATSFVFGLMASF